MRYLIFLVTTVTSFVAFNHGWTMYGQGRATLNAGVCDNLHPLLERLVKIRTIGWSAKWPVAELNRVFDMNAQLVSDDLGSTIAYTWTHEEGSRQCRESITPRNDGGVERIMVSRFAATLDEARSAGAAVVKAMAGDYAGKYGTPEGWPVVQTRKWVHIARVPENADEPQLGSLELSLLRSGSKWLVEVAFARLGG